MPQMNVVLAAIGYAALTGLFNLIFSKKTQIEAWCAANPRLAAVGMFMRSVGFDPHNLWAFATLLITKKLPAIKLANSDVVKAEIKRLDAKALASLFVLLFCFSLPALHGCAGAKQPCNEDKMRAIDKAYVADLIQACLTYPDAASCPDYLPLKAKHERDLESCPQ